MRLEARPSLSRTALVVAPFAAIAFTLGVTMLLVAWAGAPIGETYALMFDGGFGSRFAWSETLTRATPLMLTGLSAAVAFRARLWNIGAEGQLYAGALAAVAVGGLHGGTGFDLPPAVLFPAMLGAAVLAGALLLLIPTLLRTRLGVDEVVTTLLLNFIVLLFVSLMLDGPMKDPTALGWPQSVALPDDLQLDKLIPRTRVHTGIVYAIGLAMSRRHPHVPGRASGRADLHRRDRPPARRPRLHPAGPRRRRRSHLRHQMIAGVRGLDPQRGAECTT